MLIVMAEGQIAPEKKAAMVEEVAAAKVLEETCKEKGCISYEMVLSATEPGKLYILERWEDLPSLQAHMQGANFAQLGKIMAGYGVASTIALYQGERIK